MQFKEKQAIYIQIADMITDNILSRRWKNEERIPSVREMAVDMEVNPNTIARTYGYLQDLEIITNKRGIGYFVSANGRNLAVDSKRQDFIKKELPLFFKSLELLGMDLAAIEPLYKEYLAKTSSQLANESYRKSEAMRNDLSNQGRGK
jgi:DNA-binding transcriptional regulator YhcF (GntR family)